MVQTVRFFIYSRHVESTLFIYRFTTNGQTNYLKVFNSRIVFRALISKKGFTIGKSPELIAMEQASTKKVISIFLDKHSKPQRLQYTFSLQRFTSPFESLSRLLSGGDWGGDFKNFLTTKPTKSTKEFSKINSNERFELSSRV